MESTNNSRDDEKEIHARRSARIEQMKREKQLQEQRRQLIKRYFPYGIGVLGVLVVALVLAMFLPGKEKVNEEYSVEVENQDASTNATTNTPSTPIPYGK